MEYLRKELLEQYVVPVCQYEIVNNRAYIKKLFGSAFFISIEGFFLTAGHVLNVDNNLKIGLCIKDHKTFNNIISPIQNYEAYDASKIDVAIGKINSESVPIPWFTKEIMK